MNTNIDFESSETKIAEYIESLKPRRKLFGIDEESLWVIVSNIQKYYEQRYSETEVLLAQLREDNAKKDQLIAKQNLFINSVRKKYDIK